MSLFNQVGLIACQHTESLFLSLPSLSFSIFLLYLLYLQCEPQNTELFESKFLKKKGRSSSRRRNISNFPRRRWKWTQIKINPFIIQLSEIFWGKKEMWWSQFPAAHSWRARTGCFSWQTLQMHSTVPNAETVWNLIQMNSQGGKICWWLEFLPLISNVSIYCWTWAVQLKH